MQRMHQLLQEQPAGGDFYEGACLVLSPWFSSKWMEEEKEEEALLGVTLRTRQTRGSREGTMGKGGRRKKKRRGTML